MNRLLLLFILSLLPLIDLNAQIIWQNTIGGNAYEYMEDAINTSDGGFLLVGDSESGISGDKTESSKGGVDFWVVKTNNLGVVQWDKTFGGNGDDYAVSAIETSDGGFVIIGDSNSNISGDKTENSKGSYDFWIIKISSTGTKIWDKTFGGSLGETPNNIRETPTNDLIIAGRSGSNISGNKSQNSRGFADLWIIKISSTGTLIWDKTLGGNEDDELTDLELTPDGGYILAAIAESNISGDKTESTSNNEEYWVVKINSTNTVEWQKAYGGTPSSINVISDLIPTSDGGYLLAGDSDSNIGGDKTENTNGDSDLWFVKINSTGTIQWQNTVGGSDADYFPYGFQKADGGYVFAADTFSNISGDKTENSAGNDIWLIELDSNGNVTADKTFGTNSDEYPEQILQTSDGNFVIASSVDSQSGDNTEAPVGDSDYWLFKVDKNTLSISTLKTESALKVFPVPATKYVNISSMAAISSVDIIDMTGKLVNRVNSPNGLLDISTLNKGLYILKLYSENGLTIWRIVKQ